MRAAEAHVTKHVCGLRKPGQHVACSPLSRSLTLRHCRSCTQSMHTRVASAAVFDVLFECVHAIEESLSCRE
jgi:hypothetical protein